MKNLFDELAERFARDTDRALELNDYTRGRLILEMARHAVRPGQLIVDYGCGPGRLSRLLAQAGFRVRGADVSDGMISQAQALETKGLDLQFQTIANPSDVLLPQSCDAILCSSVIEYISDPESLLQQFRLALRDPGILIISFANRSSLWRWYWDRDQNSPNPMHMSHHQVWKWKEFRALLHRNGFQTLRGPQYYDSPFDRPSLARLFRHLPCGGSLGVVTAGLKDLNRR